MANHVEDKYFRYIVVGCGGIGSGAVYWLAKKCGQDVLGLEQFELGHERGGSQDYSRIIRLLYHKKIYTNIVRDTYKAWQEVERECGEQLVYLTGGLEFSRKYQPAAALVDEYAKALQEAKIPFEKLDGLQINRKYPQFRLGTDIVGIYQADSGLVDAARGNAAHIQLARGYGATVIDKCPVTRIETQGQGAVVHTGQGRFRCEKVLVTAGAWINQVLGSCGVQLPITVTQEQVTYLATPNTSLFTKDKFPVFIYHDTAYDIYALPLHGNMCFKVGVDAGGPQVTATTRTFVPDADRERAVVEFVRKYVPLADGPILQTKTCLYAMTPDRDFVIDSLSAHGKPQVVVCNGAGHAYKWASLLGKILSQMVIDGSSQYDISGFSLQREALTNPNFKPTFQMGKMGQGDVHSQL